MASKGASIRLKMFWTKTARWKQTLSLTTTNLGCPDHSYSAASWSAYRNVSIYWVLWWPIFAWWGCYPRRLMEANNDIFPTRCPGTCTITLWPFCSRLKELEWCLRYSNKNFKLCYYGLSMCLWCSSNWKKLYYKINKYVTLSYFNFLALVLSMLKGTQPKLWFF